MSWKAVKLELLGMAGAFSIQINEATLMWYSNALVHLQPEKVLAALREYGRTTKVQKLPTPAQIAELINPKLNPESEAREAASRVGKAVGLYGYVDPEGARKYIGELGWEVVQRFGGWSYICKNMGDSMNFNTLFAQMRDVAVAMYDRDLKGVGHKPPALNSTDVLELARNTVKKLE